MVAQRALDFPLKSRERPRASTVQFLIAHTHTHTHRDSHSHTHICIMHALWEFHTYFFIQAAFCSRVCKNLQRFAASSGVCISFFFFFLLSLSFGGFSILGPRPNRQRSALEALTHRSKCNWRPATKQTDPSRLYVYIFHIHFPQRRLFSAGGAAGHAEIGGRNT